MSSSQFPQWLQRIGGAIQQQNGASAAQLLLLAPNPLMIAHLQDSNRVSQSCSQYIPVKPFDQIVALHLRSVQASSVGQHANAIQMQTQAAELLYSAMESDKESNWLLPLINVLVRQLRLSSYGADHALEVANSKPRHMIDVQSLLQRFVRQMIIDRSSLATSKKLGCLFIIVHLFKLYFRLNNLKLCTFLIKMVAQLPQPLASHYPRAQVVAYQYYLGRLQVFEEKYEEAEACLEYAFQHCHRASTGNKRRILQFLVPVKLLRSRFPQEALLTKYQLPEFAALIEAIRRGDLCAFNATLLAHQHTFIARGIYLLLEKCKGFVYRNLFRKVAMFHAAETPEHSAKHQLPLETLIAALRLNGIDMSVEELECILANLIFQGQIKGYIAHRRCVVLSKQDPFPKGV